MPGVMPRSAIGAASPTPSSRSTRCSGPSRAAASFSASRSASPSTPSNWSTDASATLSSLPLSSAQRPGMTWRPTVTPLATASTTRSRSSGRRMPRTKTSAVPAECRTSPSAVAPAPDHRRHVVMAADGDDGAARRGQLVAHLAQRRARGNRLGQEVRRHAQPAQRLGPPAAVAQREQAGTRRQRQLGRRRRRRASGRSTPACRASARRRPQEGARAASRALQRAQRGGRQAGLGREAVAPSSSPNARASSGAARVVPRDRRSQRLAARGRAARRSRPCRRSRRPRRRPAGTSASARAATASAVLAIARGSTSAPVGTGRPRRPLGAPRRAPRRPASSTSALQ